MFCFGIAFIHQKQYKAGRYKRHSNNYEDSYQDVSALQSKAERKKNYTDNFKWLVKLIMKNETRIKEKLI